MDISAFLFLGVLWGGAWFWLDTRRAHEIALGVCREMCGHYDLQLLDQTISLQHTWIQRDSRRRWQFLRTYSFEFSTGGDSRAQGTLVMQGTRMTLFELPDHERVILPL